ncbi:MAG: hypothetical protein KUG81_01460 [Gammaproteobacteria bacterium]|nr:hypothetical protein [Gammaproteobacteria bacterium]
MNTKIFEFLTIEKNIIVVMSNFEPEVLVPVLALMGEEVVSHTELDFNEMEDSNLDYKLMSL